jgi:hypothetical protein
MNKKQLLGFIIIICFPLITFSQDSVIATLPKYKNYIDKIHGYKILYPENWFVKADTNIFNNKQNIVITFENLKEKVWSRNIDEELPEKGSFIMVSIHKMRDSTVKDIVENIRRFHNPDGTPQSALINKRLQDVKDFIVNGQTIKAWVPEGQWSYLEFIYHNRYCSITFRSGSEEQSDNDRSTYEAMLKSLKLLF